MALSLVTMRAAAQEPEYVAIKAGRVITVAGEEFAPGVIVIEDGKITAVGSGLEFPKTAEVIEAPRQTVMPGLIHARTRYGLRSFERRGVHGDRSASEEVYLEAVPFDELLRAGFTTVCFVPTGKGIPGMSSVYRTAGPDEKRQVDEAAYLHVETDKKSVLRDALKKAKEEIEKVEKAREEWEQKQKEKAESSAEEGPDEQEKDDEPEENGDEEGDGDDDNGDGSASVDDEDGDDDTDEAGDDSESGDDKKAEAPNEEGFKPPPIDEKYQPLVDLLRGEEDARMMVRLSSASDLLHLEDVLEPYDDLTPVLYLATRTSTDYHYVLDKFAKREAQVVIRPRIHHLPQTTVRYNLVEALAEAGCRVSVVPRYDTRIELERVRTHLAGLVRAGLDKQQVYKMLTLHPAQVLGLADRCGSIEKKRRADLVFFDGDPLDPHATVQRVMIFGKTVYEQDEEK